MGLGAFIRRFSVFSFVFVSVTILSVFSTTAVLAAPKKSETKKETQKSEQNLSTRETALRVLDSVPQTMVGESPQIMMPLQDDFKAAVRRGWDWNVELALTQRKVDVTAPSFSIGPRDTKELAAFTIAEMGVGFSKNFYGSLSNLSFGVLAKGATSVRRSDYTLGSGVNLPLTHQWISYGLEPRLTWQFSKRFGTFASILSEQVSFIQSSSESELAQWTRSFREDSTRLGLTASLNENSYALLSMKQFKNEYSSGSLWTLGLGVEW